jgi:hypothetical protein
VNEERGIEETKEELDDSRTGDVPGMMETPDESLEKDERRGDS